MPDSPLPWYYLVNDRPVMMIATPEGGMSVLAYNFQTGGFERDMSYLSRCFDGDKDVDEVTEARFSAEVDRLNKERLGS